MGEELARAVNESRLGRPLPDALATTADRMQSKDFDWVAQAIGINAETGGNLAEVLDQVGTTIRERNQVRRQVASLSAEGRLSGIILVVLPIALFLFFAFVRPDYIAVFFTNIIGIAALDRRSASADSGVDLDRVHRESEVLRWKHLRWSDTSPPE